MPCLLLTLLSLSLCSGALGSDKLVVLPCDRPLFQTKLQLCLGHFNSSLELTAYRSDCVWPEVKRSYHDLMHCVDNLAKASWCAGVGSLTDHFFLEVHETYFSECGRVRDPPLTALILMVAPLVISTLLLPLLCAHLATNE